MTIAGTSPQVTTSTPLALWRKLWRAVKAGVLLACFAGALWTFTRHTFLNYTSNALVIPHVITFRAPIAGTIQFSTPVSEGSRVKGKLGTILAVEVDDRQLHELTTALARHHVEIFGLQGQLERLDERRAQERGELASRHSERKKQLAFAAKVAQETLDAARARESEAKNALERHKALLLELATSRATLESAEREWAEAKHQVEAAQSQLEAFRTAIQASAAGHNVGVLGQSDTSTYDRSLADQLDLRLVDTRTKLDVEKALTSALENSLAAEKARVSALSEQTFELQGDGRILSQTAADGEFVPRGAPLLEVFSCEQYTAVAYVDKRVFSRLVVGQRARLRLKSKDIDVEGSVTEMLGPLMEARGSLPQLKLSTLDEYDDYRVVLSFPDLSTRLANSCDGVLTGEVYFEVTSWIPW